MKWSNIVDASKKIFKNVKVKAVKNSSTIFVVSGIVLGLTGAVVACKATKDAVPVINKTKEQVKNIHERMEKPVQAEDELHYLPVLDEKDGKKMLKIVYTKTAWDLFKLYFVSISLEALSVTSILVGHHILKERNVALMASYITLGEQFKAYRERVKNKYGEEEEKKLRYDFFTTTDEEGNVVEVMGKVEEKEDGTHYVNPNGYSEFFKVFDETNPYYEKSAEYNKSMLMAKQAQFNNILHADGFVFLNDVYKAIGFPPTKAGQIVGWMYKPDDPNHKGDNYIDFGIMDVCRPKVADFVNGYERAIILDFNVDGPIIDQI